jgi:transmembrane sensor
MKRDDNMDMTLAEQAARWLRSLEKGGTREQAEFAAWLKESPRHIEEVLCATAVSQALGRLDESFWPDVSQHVAEAGKTVVSLRDRIAAPTLTRPPRRKLWLAACAAVLVCAVGVWGFHELLGWREYETAVGEQRTLMLDDGSLAYLNTRSHINVRFSSEVREVQLAGGEALFDVEHDPARPFLVRTNDAVIRAVGTQFNVYRRTSGTVVSVVEGVVEVSTRQGSLRFSAGEEARIAHGGVKRAQKIDVTRTAVWRQRRLVFDLDPLEEVAAEFNRYNRAPTIRIEGEAARIRRFSGVFDVDDPASLTKLLATYSDLRVDDQGTQIVIQAR